MAKLARIVPQKVRSLLGKVGKLFKKKPPPKPRVGGMGHRGIAAGNLKKRHEAAAAFHAGTSKVGPYTEEEIEKWETLSPNVVDLFLYSGQILYVNSSNVDSAQFIHDKSQLIIRFKNGGMYAYSDVSDNEALHFAQQSSKGGFVWDSLRIRGSKTGHHKPYRKVSSWQSVNKPNP